VTRETSRTILVVVSILMLAGLAFFALASAMPSFMQIPDIDYSIFQYFGERMREGQLPYRDVYDHKPPLIFYIDAWGLALGNGSRWGIWALQLAAVGAAGLFGFAALRRTFGLYPAWLAAAGFLANLVFVHEGGNLTEEYALPFQFAAIWLLVEMESRRQGGLRALLIGVCLGLASSLKQPLAGPLAAVGVVMLFSRLSRRDWRALLDFIWLGLGFGLVWAGWFAYFASQGALAEFWEAAFAYNFALSGITVNQRLDALVEGLKFLLGISPYFAVSFAAWAAGIVYLVLNEEPIRKALTQPWLGWLVGLAGLLLAYNGLFRSGLQLYRLSELSVYRLGLIFAGALLLGLGLAYSLRRWDRPARAWLERHRQSRSTPVWAALIFAVVDLPVEIVLSSLSGNNFRHYFMAVLPSMTVLIAYLAWSLASDRSTGKRGIRPVWAAAAIIPLVVGGAFATADKIGISRDRDLDAVIQYVETATAPQDYVLQWGDFPMINTVSGRKSPSRYFFIDPLFLPNYTSLYHSGAYLADLQAHPPALIIDTRPVSQPLFYEYNAQDCSKLLDTDYLAGLAEKIKPDSSKADNWITNYKDKYFKTPQIPPGMPEVYHWICQNYDEEIVMKDWIIFRYLPNRP